ncbi:MAG: PEP-CTERM sorting domain-containing protein, partial [Planctomycetaceae bacterium]
IFGDIAIQGGTLSGTIVSTGAVTMTSGSYQWSATDLSTFDSISAASANLTGGSLVIDLGSYTPEATDTWTILTTTGLLTSSLVAPEGYTLTVVDGNSLVLSIGSVPAYNREGDANHDGFIDGTDLGIIGDNWSPVYNESLTWEQGDFNGDHMVDGTDLGLLGDNWNPAGYEPSSDLGTPVPEPITMTLLAIGSLGLLARRNRK